MNPAPIEFTLTYSVCRPRPDCSFLLMKVTPEEFADTLRLKSLSGFLGARFRCEIYFAAPAAQHPKGWQVYGDGPSAREAEEIDMNQVHWLERTFSLED